MFNTGIVSKLMGGLTGRVDRLESEVQNLRLESNYLQTEVSRLRSLVRHLTADIIHELPMQRQTKDSFDYQWDGTSDGNWVDEHPEIREREPRLVCDYTGLRRDWFDGKRVLDAGCGSGRFSWAMASMGASVMSLDQSPAGVRNTQRACAEFGDRVTVRQHDLTQPTDLPQEFDLVWSFGVLHHTGNTYGAFKNIAPLVRPGGYIFLMLYGEPTGRDPGEFAYYHEVESLRRKTVAMDFNERLKYLESLKGENAGGWFDAVSPEINDTYSFYEIQLWLQRAGFENIRRPYAHSSHHVIAQRPLVP
ncbi:MAG: class I SAM-dependent methyltransferase [Alphaproteobacteria bacterium]|nr:class I SAM-dependent methyltransferase [Alphaproteobacteria bacterium]